MTTDERRDIIETLVHHFVHELDPDITETEKKAAVSHYRTSLYNMGNIDLLEYYETTD